MALKYLSIPTLKEMATVFGSEGNWEGNIKEKATTTIRNKPCLILPDISLPA